MKLKTNTLLVIIGSILFHLLFWQESAGLNTLLFYLFITGACIFLNQEEPLSKYARYTVGCTFLVALSVVINNSVISIVVFWMSFMAMIGFIHQQELSFFLYGIPQYLRDLTNVPKAISSSKFESEEFSKKWKKALSFIKIAIIPLIIVSVFFLIYRNANPFFAKYSDGAFEWFSAIPFENISFGSILFFLLGFVIVGGALWDSLSTFFVDSNNTFTTVLKRERKGITYEKPLKSLSLKTEYRMALLVMIMLNVLLLFVNLVDLNFVWFNFEKTADLSLKSFVHEGTYLLIVSILLASALIMYYFRENLNFYPENKNLRLATYAWIAQNVLLTLSVGVRNFRYVEYHGFAHLRVGVFIFLIAVIYGLYTVYKKVKDQRSLYFLLHKNSWLVYTLLILTSLVNWDVVITRYNIAAETIKPLHITFLASSSSDKNLFLLEQKTEEILRQLPKGVTETYFKERIEWKRANILYKAENTSLFSWNYADYRNIKWIEKKQ